MVIRALLFCQVVHPQIDKIYEALGVQDLARTPREVIALYRMRQDLSKNSSNVMALRTQISKRYRALFSQSISSLTPNIDEAGFEPLFKQLENELRSKKLDHIKIETYFGDEWFCPDGTTAIAVPFWLADSRLKSIERELIGYVEGETRSEFMKLLRHEAGHCIEHAYKLSKRHDWQQVFGDPKKEYNPEAQKTIKNHPDFVQNLPDGYAQTHPEEDFAETFAVWLNSKSNWRVKYKNKPTALNKILFIDELIKDICAKRPKNIRNQKTYQARRMKKSLETYYLERLRSSIH
jgi:Putative zinc-binding metallo-peptidase